MEKTAELVDPLYYKDCNQSRYKLTFFYDRKVQTWFCIFIQVTSISKFIPFFIAIFIELSIIVSKVLQIFFLSQQLSEKTVSTNICYGGSAKINSDIVGVHLIKGQEISEIFFLFLKYQRFSDLYIFQFLIQFSPGWSFQLYYGMTLPNFVLKLCFLPSKMVQK